MSFYQQFKNDLFNTHPGNFEEKALELFDFQYHSNNVYKSFCSNLGIKLSDVDSVKQIPFLPIDFFKTHDVKSGDWKPEKIFFSSGTTGQVRSKNLVRDLEFYHAVTEKIFESKYGNISDQLILALLPSYQQQGQSSLISMVDHFISKAKEVSGYFLNDDDSLSDLLTQDSSKILIGVSYALLDLVESKELATEKLIVMETGGMKGRRSEIIRDELHDLLQYGFGVEAIHSEYGMTELCTQAYSSRKGLFSFPSWARCLVRDINDPFSYTLSQKTGGLNIIDLANIDTCAFIETKDLGSLHNDWQFQIIGRFDNTDIRGCNLLVT